MKIGDGKFCHVRSSPCFHSCRGVQGIHQPLPHTGAAPNVHSVQVDKVWRSAPSGGRMQAEGDALEYFG